MGKDRRTAGPGRWRSTTAAEGRVAVARHAHHPVATRVQQLAQNGPEPRVVVDHQHPRKCHHGTSLPTGAGRGCSAGPSLRR